MIPGIQVFDLSGVLIADWTYRANPITVDDGERGFGSVKISVPMSQSEAFDIYDQIAFADVKISDETLFPIFEGRIEDRKITPKGITVQAFGYWSALRDVPYSGLWSESSYADWTPATEDDQATRKPDLWNMDNNNRLYFSPKDGGTFRNNNDAGALQYFSPNLGEADPKVLTFDYDITLPTDWLFVVDSYTEGYGSVAANTIATGDGTNQTGSSTITLTNARPIIQFLVYNATGSTVTALSNPDGQIYAKATSLRVKSTTSANVYADEIADALVAFVNGVNSSQLSASTGWIESPSVDLFQEVYEDALPADILRRLALFGDNSTPPKIYDTGVWENQQVRFYQRELYSKHWYVTSEVGTIDSTTETLRNSVYAVYQDERGRVMRTADDDSAAYTEIYGVTKRAPVGVDTTSATQADTKADAFLADNEVITPRSSLKVRDFVEDETGAVYPFYFIRPWDLVTDRRLPPNTGSEIDKIRTFRVTRTTKDFGKNMVTIYPELSPPNITEMVAPVAPAQLPAATVTPVTQPEPAPAVVPVRDRKRR